MFIFHFLSEWQDSDSFTRMNGISFLISSVPCFVQRTSPRPTSRIHFSFFPGAFPPYPASGRRAKSKIKNTVLEVQALFALEPICYLRGM